MTAPTPIDPHAVLARIEQHYRGFGSIGRDAEKLARAAISLLAEIDALTARIAELEAALDDGVSTVELLADQQAMSDDWYLPSLDQMRRALGGES